MSDNLLEVLSVTNRLLSAFTLIWPLTLVGTIAIVARRALGRPLAFLCIGVLACYGATLFVGTVAGLMVDRFTEYPPSHETPAEMATAIWKLTFRVTAGAVLVSAAPIFWLYRAFLKSAMPREHTSAEI